MMKFDKKAMNGFNQIPDKVKSKILSNLNYSKCSNMVKIAEFEATINKNDLILKDRCEKCSNSVSRLIGE